MPDRAVGGRAAWRGADLARSRDWVRVLEPAELGELEEAARAVRAAGRPLDSVGSEDFPLPRLAAGLEEVREELLHGRGFLVLRGLRVADRPAAETATLFWGIGAHLGAALPQNARGDLIGHVRDEGRDGRDPAARIYQTNERQGWHTDSADFAALLCVRPAREGGKSSLVSAPALHDALLERSPELLPRLFEPFCTDHRGEHRPGAPPYFTAPVLSWHAGELSVLYQRRYIESAQRFGGVPRLTAEQVAALDAFDALADDPALHLTFDMRPGDVLALHNHQLLHDRAAFVDWPETGRRRHLLRLWLCPPAGRPLPDCFAERFGAVEPGLRGGVVLPGIAPSARVDR